MCHGGVGSGSGSGSGSGGVGVSGHVDGLLRIGDSPY